MSEDKSGGQELARWRKKIEMIGIDIKGLDQETNTGRKPIRVKELANTIDSILKN